MLSSVTGVPYSYYNALNPPSASVAPAAKAPTTDTAGMNTAIASLGALLGNTSSTDRNIGLLASSSLSPDVLSLLQGYGSEATSLSGLFGGGDRSGGTPGLLEGSFYTSLLSAAYQGFSTSGAGQSASPVQSLVSAYQKAINAYSATTASDSRAVVQANSYQADGKTALVV